jgi:surface carbohydrate biosynthesis protein
MSFEILNRTALNFFKKSQKKINIKKRLKQSYYKSLILSLKPKAVITLIDNNQIFNYLSKTIKSIPFIAIQNGLRHPFEESDNTFHIQHYFSFGKNEKKYFSKFNMEVENYYPSGSLLSSIFSKKNIENENDKFDILIVSCWRGNIGYGKDVQDSMESMRIVDNLLSKYLAKKKLKAAIILRSERDGEHWYMPEIGLTEEQYFKSIYTKNVKIIDADFKNYNIYKLIVNSNLLVSSFGTTTLLEGYGIGKKILYTIFYGDKIYHEIFDESILCLNPDQGYFENKLDEIISTDKEKYIKEHKKNMRFYMNQPKPDTLNFIKNKINEIISNQNEN